MFHTIHKCLGAMAKRVTWLTGSKNGCLEALLACLGPKTSGLPSMENDLKPFDGKEKVVWARRHCIAWAHDKLNGP
jgi:hypothetical protein